MIAVLPQSGQRHGSVNGPADEGQWQWVSGCFIGGTLFATVDGEGEFTEAESPLAPSPLRTVLC